MAQFRYQEHVEILEALAEEFFGGDIAGLDVTNSAANDNGNPWHKPSLVRGVVTTQASAATKTGSGSSLQYTAGIDGTFAMLEMFTDGTPTPTDSDQLMPDGTDNSTVEFSVRDDEIYDDAPLDIPFLNLAEKDLEVDDVIELAHIAGQWVHFGAADTEEPPKRCKFVLTSKIMVAGVGYWADANIVDPINSGLSVGTAIKVRDPHKQFPFGIEGCMGFAHFSKLGDGIYPIGPNPPDTYTGADQGQWLIEQCDQLVNKAKAVTSGGIVAWESPSATSNINILSSESYWPFIHWSPADDSVLTGVENDKNFTANPGFLWLERRVVEVEEPDSTNYETPKLGEIYDEVEWQWHITGVERPVARYAETKYNGSEFLVDADGSFYEGYDPEPNLIFTDLGGNHIDAFDELPCPLANEEKGIAFLDDKEGKYRTFATMSAMYGTAKQINLVAEVVEDGPPLPSDGPVGGVIGTTTNTECGEFKYQFLKNAFVFGNPDAATDCRLEYEDPPPIVDTFANAQDVTVVTGAETNPITGELELTAKTIKACPSTAANIPLSYNTTDVITNVECNADGVVEKTYKQIKYIGSDVAGSSNTLELSCTDVANYNWETIFNNYIFNSNWWSVSYYDITYPDGCEPCPTGCCSGGTYDGQEVTETDCTSGGGSWSSSPCDTGCCTGGTYDGQDVSEYKCMTEGGGTSWSSSPCGGGSGCENTTISGFSIGGFASAGCSASFTQTGTATITGGTATINGTWSGLSSNFPVGSVAGTFTFTTDGTNHSATGTLPSDWGSNTVSVSDTGTCGGTYSGMASLSGSGTPCGDMINGTYDFTLS